MRRAAAPFALIATLGLGACAVAPPPGPSVIGMPGQGKSFEAFQQDDATCRDYASAQVGGATPAAAANQAAVGSAVVGTALGAAAGAALGSVGGALGAGAAIGGATGLLAGSAYGSNNAAFSAAGVQQRYDVSYAQCLSAHGDTVQAPPTGYAGGYPPPYGYSYPYPSGYYYGPAYPYYAPPVVVGFGGGWGWGGWRGGWGWGGWHGGWQHWH